MEEHHPHELHIAITNEGMQKIKTIQVLKDLNDEFHAISESVTHYYEWVREETKGNVACFLPPNVASKLKDNPKLQQLIADDELIDWLQLLDSKDPDTPQQ